MKKNIQILVLMILVVILFGSCNSKTNEEYTQPSETETTHELENQEEIDVKSSETSKTNTSDPKTRDVEYKTGVSVIENSAKDKLEEYKMSKIEYLLENYYSNSIEMLKAKYPVDDEMQVRMRTLYIADAIEFDDGVLVLAGLFSGDSGGGDKLHYILDESIVSIAEYKYNPTYTVIGDQYVVFVNSIDLYGTKDATLELSSNTVHASVNLFLNPNFIIPCGQELPEKISVTLGSNYSNMSYYEFRPIFSPMIETKLAESIPTLLIDGDVIHFERAELNSYSLEKSENKTPIETVFDMNYNPLVQYTPNDSKIDLYTDGEIKAVYWMQNDGNNKLNPVEIFDKNSINFENDLGDYYYIIEVVYKDVNYRYAFLVNIMNI